MFGLGKKTEDWPCDQIGAMTSEIEHAGQRITVGSGPIRITFEPADEENGKPPCSTPVLDAAMASSIAEALTMQSYLVSQATWDGPQVGLPISPVRFGDRSGPRRLVDADEIPSRHVITYPKFGFYVSPHCLVDITANGSGIVLIMIKWFDSNDDAKQRMSVMLPYAETQLFSGMLKIAAGLDEAQSEKFEG